MVEDLGPEGRYPLPLHLDIEELEHTIKQAQDITPEQSRTRVLIYEGALILTHAWATVVFCLRCGKSRLAVTHAEGKLNPAGFQNLDPCYCSLRGTQERHERF